MTPTDSKTRILQTAITLFSEQGFSAVSMREIAKAVGISAPALYNHFDSKDALYQAAVSAAFANKAEGVLQVLGETGEPLDRLGRFIFLVAELVRQDPSFRVLMQRELLDGDAARLGFLGRMVYSPIEQPLIRLLEALRPGCDGALLVELIFGMVTQHDEMRLLHPFLDQPASRERSPGQIARQVMAVLTPYFAEASR